MSEQPKPATPTARAPDPYEAKYMEGEGGALYHDKFPAPPIYHLFFLLPLLIQITAVVAAHAPIFVPLLTGLPLVLLWLLFAVLRVSVTPKEVHVQYGLFGPKIPIADVERCEAVDYDWKQYGGWGIRYGRDGSTVYNMLGDQGRAVKLVYTKGGASKTVLLSSRDPERLAAAVNQARAAALLPGASGLRVEASPGARIADEAAARDLLAEQEQAAEEGAAAREVRKG
jgi:hypothetical protein